jgi:hypothetical protein
VVAGVPRPDLPDELEKGEAQVDAAQDHVPSHQGRVLEEAGVVWLLEVVSDGGPNAHERQEAQTVSATEPKLP